MSTTGSDTLFYQVDYLIRAYEIDHRKQMTIPALVRLMQEAAMQHVLQLKLSVWDLEPEHMAWVLMRLQLEVSRLPLLAETVTIKTCPTGLDRILTYRNFWIYDAEGQLIAEAVTHWVLMDTQSRRLRSIPQWIEARFAQLIPKTYSGLQPSRHKLPALVETEYQKTFHVRWHDLDFNLHLNNTYYVLYLLEGLPADWLSAHTLTHLDIIYKSELTVDEDFQIQVQQLDSGGFIHGMLQGEERKLLAEMTTRWR